MLAGAGQRTPTVLAFRMLLSEPRTLNRTEPTAVLPRVQCPAEKRSPPRFRLPTPREPSASGKGGRGVPLENVGGGAVATFSVLLHLKASSGVTDPAALYRVR